MSMWRHAYLLPLLIVPIVSAVFFARQELADLVQGLPFTSRDEPRRIDYFRIASESTGRSYEVYVQLPAGYARSETLYPVIYAVQSRPYLMIREDEVAPLMREAVIANAIIVEVSPVRPPIRVWLTGKTVMEGDPARWSDDLTLHAYTSREGRTYGGGASRFLAFFADELMPKIESSYRVQPGDRCLGGHDLGGLFVLSAAFTRPELFSRYIAIGAPAQWAGFAIVRTAEERMRSGFHPGVNLYIAIGSGDGPSSIQGFQLLSRTLDPRRTEGLRVKAEMLENLTRTTVLIPAARKGLNFVYDK